VRLSPGAGGRRIAPTRGLFPHAKRINPGDRDSLAEDPGSSEPLSEFRNTNEDRYQSVDVFAVVDGGQTERQCSSSRY
jgi:hypothetical protein